MFTVVNECNVSYVHTKSCGVNNLGAVSHNSTILIHKVCTTAQITHHHKTHQHHHHASIRYHHFPCHHNLMTLVPSLQTSSMFIILYFPLHMIFLSFSQHHHHILSLISSSLLLPPLAPTSAINVSTTTIFILPSFFPLSLLSITSQL